MIFFLLGIDISLKYFLYIASPSNNSSILALSSVVEGVRS